MNIFSRIRRARLPMLFGAFAGLLLTGLVVVFTSQAHGIGIGGPRDNDANAVIRGGVPDTSALVASYNSDATVRAIYDFFHISKTDIQAMGTTAVAGKITKSGDVMAGNAIVATGALTAGRQTIGNSTRVVHNGATFYTRTPSVSFQSDSLDAYVVMKNGQFAFAVIASCGNPVNATPKTQPKPQPQPQPKPRPSATLTKEVQAKGESAWHKNITAQPGDHVMFRFIASSTGNAPLTNALLQDTMPAHATFVEGTFKQDGTTLSSQQAHILLGSGAQLGSVPAQAQSVYMFEAVIAPSETQDTCMAETLTNMVRLSATGITPLQDTATVTVQCQQKQPQSSFACTSLTATPGVIDASGKQTYTFTAMASATNAAITGYTFKFDNPNQSDQIVTTSATTAAGGPTVYAPGTYHPSVTVHVTPNGGGSVDVNDARCMAVITVNQPASPVQPVVFTTPLPPSTPPALINTGSGDVIGMFAATTIAGAIAYRVVWLRRLGLHI
jgi:uncharacterized repeat protein (TIGR01451 family)